jgi:hypothetical protein
MPSQPSRANSLSYWENLRWKEIAGAEKAVLFSTPPGVLKVTVFLLS